MDATDGLDELWNLMPMDSSLNSTKSNRLPKWEPFFIRFADNQYQLFFNILDKNMHPVYDSARRQGYELWNYAVV